jgi:hypothetical protein
MAAKAKKIAVGARVQTNDKFSKLFQPPTTKPWTGSVVRAHTPISGCWTVRVDHVPHLQFINEAYLEVAP